MVRTLPVISLKLFWDRPVPDLPQTLALFFSHLLVNISRCSSQHLSVISSKHCLCLQLELRPTGTPVQCCENGCQVPNLALGKLAWHLAKNVWHLATFSLLRKAVWHLANLYIVPKNFANFLVRQTLFNWHDYPKSSFHTVIRDTTSPQFTSWLICNTLNHGRLPGAGLWLIVCVKRHCHTATVGLTRQHPRKL